MKKIIGLKGVLILTLFFSAVNAQETWDPKKNPTVDSITAPFESKLLKSEYSVTPMDIYPVLGSYESSTNTDAPVVSITLDDQMKGVVWIEGLPQGKIKAYLRKSPATYKIPAQKTEDGKNVPEGTLIFDKEENMLSINIGKPYNSEDPGSVFMMTDENTDTAATTSNEKTKTNSKTVKTKIKEPKPWTYTGTKIEKATASNQ